MSDPSEPRAPGAKCVRCCLPASYAGADVDATGTCRLCRESGGRAWPSLGEAALRDLIARRAGSSPIACLVGYSGGKDSTYMLRRLSEWFPGRVLAFTYDTQVMSEHVWGNIERVVARLGVQWIRHQPEAGFMPTMFQRTFPKLVELRRQGTIYARGAVEFGPLCWQCGTLYHLEAVRVARERGIPTVAVGFTPAQDSTHYPHANAFFERPEELHRERHDARAEGMSARDYTAMTSPILKLIASAMGPAAVERYRALREDPGLESLRILRFYDYVPYDETTVRAGSAEVGFESPPDSGYGSTNCTLNPLIRHAYEALYGVDKYLAQDAALVRWGFGKREEVAARVSPLPTREEVQPLAERIGISPAELDAILDPKK